MVPVDESEVYETVLPMCGPGYHLNGLDGEPDAEAGATAHRLLSRLRPPTLSDCFSPLLERVCAVSRRT